MTMRPLALCSATAERERVPDSALEEMGFVQKAARPPRPQARVLVNKGGPMARSREDQPAPPVATGSVGLSQCRGCGATLTRAFRFCPGCGLPGDDSGGWAHQSETAVFPRVERRNRPRRRVRPTPRESLFRSAGQSLVPVTQAARRLRSRTSDFARALGRRLGVGALRLAATCGEAARLMVEIIVVCAGSARDRLRSTVLLHRLHGHRAALIYTAGYAALSGDDHRVEHARAEVRLLDEMITAASDRMTFALAPDEAATAPDEAPTEESVSVSRPAYRI